MIFFFHILIVLFFALAMTLCSVGFPLCNLLVVYVVFIALACPSLAMGLFFILLAGMINDGMSAVSFGVFTLTFFWLFCIVRVLGRFVQQNSLLFALLAVFAGIVLENFFIVLSFLFRDVPGEIWPLAGKVLLGEFLSAIVLAPFLLISLRMLTPRLFYPRKTDIVALALRSSSQLK
ncbi:hypothetical protein LJC24_00220 [Desulfococcaceae bacterium OttesenSCG-928-F15]|nr:hypothetical protein [Desulfococcaceae bacterium OttesenSCG-928-F15]